VAVRCEALDGPRPSLSARSAPGDGIEDEAQTAGEARVVVTGGAVRNGAPEGAASSVSLQRGEVARRSLQALAEHFFEDVVARH
jgi:hypothetical protein